MVASGIESLSILIDHGFEVFDTCLERGENALNVSFEVLKLLILNMHNLEFCENFQKLLVDVIDEGVHKEDGPVMWIRISTSWSQKPKLIKDQLNGMLDKIEVTCRKELVDWEVLKELIVVSSLLQLLGKICVEFKMIDKLDLIGSLQELLGNIDHWGLKLVINVSEGPLDAVPEVNLLDSLSFGWIIIHLSNFSNVSDPLSDDLFKPLNKGGICKILLEVIGLHLNLSLLAFFKSGSDLRIMNELDLWNDDVLLALDQVYFELVQVFLDILKTLRSSSFPAQFAQLVGIEQWDERVFNVCSSELKDVKVISDVSEIDDLHLLRDVVLRVCREV